MELKKRKFIKIFGLSIASIIFSINDLLASAKKIINSKLSNQQKNIMFNEATERPYSSKLLNEKRNITYAQNTRSAIRNTTDISHNYVVTPDIPNNVEETTFTVKCQQNVVKYRNRKFNTNSAVSGRSRIARLKYNTELQSSYGNAVNGTLISRQGVGHYARPPNRNNKIIDNNPNCSERRTSQRSGIWGLGRLRCNNLTSQGSKNRAAFDFAKK